MNNDQPHNASSGPMGEPDRELLWDFVYELLDEAATADVRSRISANPAWARAYADVVLRCNELAEAAKVQDDAHDWQAIRHSAESDAAVGDVASNNSAPANANTAPAPRRDAWRRRMARILSVAAALLLIASLVPTTHRAPDPVAMIGDLPELTVVGPLPADEADTGDTQVDTQFGVATHRRQVTIRLQTMEGDPLPDEEAEVALARGDELVRELKVVTDHNGAATFSYSAEQQIEKVNVRYLSQLAFLNVAETTGATTSKPAAEATKNTTEEAMKESSAQVAVDSTGPPVLARVGGRPLMKAAENGRHDGVELSFAQNEKYQILDFYSSSVANEASEATDSSPESGQGAGQSVGTEIDVDRRPLTPNESFIVEAASEQKPVYVLSGFASANGVVRAKIPRTLSFSEVELRSLREPRQRMKWRLEPAAAALSAPPPPQVARNWDSLEHTYKTQWQKSSAQFVQQATRFGVFGLALGAGMLVVVVILYFLRAVATPVSAAGVAASLLCLMAAATSLQSAKTQKGSTAEGAQLFRKLIAQLESHEDALAAVPQQQTQSQQTQSQSREATTWEEVAQVLSEAKPDLTPPLSSGGEPAILVESDRAFIQKFDQKGLAMYDDPVAESLRDHFDAKSSVDSTAGARLPPLESRRDSPTAKPRQMARSAEQESHDPWLADAELRLGDNLVFTGFNAASTGFAEPVDAASNRPAAAGADRRGRSTDKLKLDRAQGFSHSSSDFSSDFERLAVRKLTETPSRAMRAETLESWFVPPATIQWKSPADLSQVWVREGSLTIFPSRQSILREAARAFEAPANQDETLAQQYFLRQAIADQQQQTQGDAEFLHWARSRYQSAEPAMLGLEKRALAALPSSQVESWFGKRLGKAADNLRIWGNVDWSQLEQGSRQQPVGKSQVVLSLTDGTPVATADVEPQANEPMRWSWGVEAGKKLNVNHVGEKVVVRARIRQLTDAEPDRNPWRMRFDVPAQAKLGDSIAITGELTAKSAQERVVVELPLPAGLKPSTRSAAAYNRDSRVLRYYFDEVSPEQPGEWKMQLRSTDVGEQQAPAARVYSMEDRGAKSYWLPSFRLPVDP